MVKWPNCHVFSTNKIDMENALQAPADLTILPRSVDLKAPAELRQLKVGGATPAAHCLSPSQLPLRGDVYLSTYLSIYLPICLFVFLRFCLSVSLWLCLSVFLWFCFSVFHRSIHLSVYLSLYARWSFNSHSAFLLYFMHIWFIFVCICQYAICFIDNRGIQGQSPLYKELLTYAEGI